MTEQTLAQQTERREHILALEKAILERPQVEIQTFHHFAKGLYARTIFIPAGTVLTGKIHREEHLNILSEGTIAVVTDEGEKLINAVEIFVAPAGTKRVGYTVTDTIWTTIHASEERDLKRLETTLIAPDFEALKHDPVPALGDESEEHF